MLVLLAWDIALLEVAVEVVIVNSAEPVWRCYWEPLLCQAWRWT